MNKLNLPHATKEKMHNKQLAIDIRMRRELGDISLKDLTGKELEVPERLNKLNSYNYKVKFTGNEAEAILYSDNILTGYARKHTPQRKEGRTMANAQNIKRARKNVYDIVNCNFTPYTKMLTLTYKETMLDYDKLYMDYKAFMKHLKRKGFNLPYLAITEHQTKRGKKEGNAGSLHIHALLFTDEYIPFKTIKTAWGERGSVHIEKIDKADNKGAYVAKYITKEGAPADKKSYRTSRNIKRPTYKVGLGDELDIINSLGGEFDFKSQSYYTVERGHNQETGEIKEEIKAEVFKYSKPYTKAPSPRTGRGSLKNGTS